MSQGTIQEDNSNAPWYQLSGDDALVMLESDSQGLSHDEAEYRLSKYGLNTIQSDQKVSPWVVLWHQFASPLVYVLLGALVVTLAIQSYGDAIVICLVLLVNATIGFIQEYRAESAVQSLMQMVSPSATVRRAGETAEIDSKQLVPGDIVVVGEGDMIPADVRLLNSNSLQVDESALTGESVPVAKSQQALRDADEHLPPADQKNMAFMGTAITAGRGEAIVVATGTNTELGDIAEDVRSAGEIKTPLQRRMDRLARAIAIAILLTSAAAFGVGLLLGKSVEQMFLLAVSLSVAAIPAGLPVVMTVALAIGVRRMAQQHAVIRHLPAVETLGSTNTIVSDKTGTLTQNRMMVSRIVAGKHRYRVTGEALSAAGHISADPMSADPVSADSEMREETAVEPEPRDALYDTLLAGLLNNSADIVKLPADGDTHRQDPDPSLTSDKDDSQKQQASVSHASSGNAASSTPSSAGQDTPTFEPQGDPMEVALLIAAWKVGLRRDELLEDYPQVDEIPFQTEQRFSATIHESQASQDDPLVLIKGAPEVILEMCAYQRTSEGAEEELERDYWESENERLGSEGLRVLAMAIGRGQESVDSIQSDTPHGMTLVGLQGLLDPPRAEAISAVDQCHEAGIRVIMVTGDHAHTASAIAAQVHLQNAPNRSFSNGHPSTHSKEDGDEDSESQNDSSLEAHTGQEIADWSDEQIDEALQHVNVFARFRPDQKLRLIERLKASDHIVAVTGDGVNDAPALKSAHLGAAMGQTGTDVAKEASDMVITDDNFASIYAAVEQGRTAFRNIRMATFFLLSTGAADVFIILTALLLRWELPLLPAQILWCNVVTNGIADVALGFEPGEKALYRRPPRPPSEGVLDRTLIERLFVVGVWLAIGTLGVFWWVNDYRGDGVDLARVAALTTLVLFQKVHVFNCRSQDLSIFKKSLWENKILFVGVLTSLAIHIAAMYIPWTQQLLNFQPLPWEIWAVSIAVAATAIVVNELLKWLRPRPGVSQKT